MIIPNFKTYWQDQLTAEVKIENNLVKIKRYDTNPAKQMFCKDTMQLFELGSILETRCWSEDRADLEFLLNSIGLHEYNVYEIVQKTHGVTVQDYIWIEFEGDHLNAREVLKKTW